MQNALRTAMVKVLKRAKSKTCIYWINKQVSGYAKLHRQPNTSPRASAPSAGLGTRSRPCGNDRNLQRRSAPMGGMPPGPEARRPWRQKARVTLPGSRRCKARGFRHSPGGDGRRLRRDRRCAVLPELVHRLGVGPKKRKKDPAPRDFSQGAGLFIVAGALRPSGQELECPFRGRVAVIVQALSRFARHVAVKAEGLSLRWLKRFFWNPTAF